MESFARNGCSRGQRLDVAQSLIAGKEEHVLDFRHGAAVDEPELIATQRRDRTARHARRGLIAIRWVEEVLGIELIVAQKVPGRSSILIRSGPCAHDDL